MNQTIDPKKVMALLQAHYFPQPEAPQKDFRLKDLSALKVRNNGNTDANY